MVKGDADREPRGVEVDEFAELVDLAARGDRGAFQRLVELTHRDVHGLALRLVGHEEDACDVVQEAYVRAWRGIGSFRGDARFSTWMYRITANTASNHLRSRRRHRHESLDSPSGGERVVVDQRPEHQPELAAEGSAALSSLETAVRSLPPGLRAVVVLRDVYELPHEAIAEELGISETAAKVRLHRARKRLREQWLRDQGSAAPEVGPP